MRDKLRIVLLCSLLLSGCREKYTPKPRGYFRIDFPAKMYHSIPGIYPYHFEIPDYSGIVPDFRNPDQPFWINITVPANKAEIHISYYNFSNTGNPNRVRLQEFMEESRTLAYKHTIKADAIDEQIFVNPEKKVFGTIYNIKGNAASPYQFYLTDSTRHFLRGALYIRETPNIDSLKPVIEFLESDVVHLIETTTWN